MTMTMTARRVELAYWIPTGLFCLVFVGSAASYLIDPVGARETYVRLGFAGFLLYPTAAAKLLGVAAILYPRWQTVKTFAFAGFLFDMLLALIAHAWHRDPQGWLAVAGLALWVLAYRADRRRFPVKPVESRG